MRRELKARAILTLPGSPARCGIIADMSFTDSVRALVQDGSPPLYYLLLHVWMQFAGTGEAATRSLSLLFALLAIPVSFAAGSAAFDRRTGALAAAGAAGCPFLTYYAQETRMYSLVVVLSTAACASFVLAFVRGRTKHVPLLGLYLVLLLYTHNWGLFLGAGLALGLIPCWYVSENRSSFWKDALIGFGFAGLLYVPWLPTLLHQVQHTGAPWLNPPNFGAPVQITKSLLGGGTPTVALVLAGGSGIAAILARRVEDKERTAVIAGAVTVLATLAVAWLVSQVSPAWTTRYLGVLLGPMLLIAALGLARAGVLGFVALAIILSIWAIPRSYGLDNKSNASDLRNAVVPDLHEGDLVVSMQPEQGPLLAYHLEDLGGAPKLRFASPIGAVKNDRVMDWTDAYDELKAATPTKNLQPLLANLPPGGRVLFVYPITSRADDWDAPWTELVRRRGAQWGAALAADKSFKWVAAVPPNYRRATRIGVRGVVYEKKAVTG